jgi:hypothetical protein
MSQLPTAAASAPSASGNWTATSPQPTGERTPPHSQELIVQTLKIKRNTNEGQQPTPQQILHPANQPTKPNRANHQQLPSLSALFSLVHCSRCGKHAHNSWSTLQTCHRSSKPVDKHHGQLPSRTILWCRNHAYNNCPALHTWRCPAILATPDNARISRSGIYRIAAAKAVNQPNKLWENSRNLLAKHRPLLAHECWLNRQGTQKLITNSFVLRRGV